MANKKRIRETLIQYFVGQDCDFENLPSVLGDTQEDLMGDLDLSSIELKAQELEVDRYHHELIRNGGYAAIKFVVEFIVKN